MRQTDTGKTKKNKQPGLPTRLSGEVLLDHFDAGDHKLHTAVLGATFLAAIVSNRLRLAFTGSGDAAAINTIALQIIGHRAGTTLRE